MLFLKDKPALLLLKIKEAQKPIHISELARQAGVTYVYATSFLRMLESVGVVQFVKKGKLKIVELTDKGRALADAIDAAKKAEENM